MAFLAQVSTQQVITKSISTVTLDVSSITGIVIGTLQPGDLTSTIQGLGTLGYISSASSSSTPSTLSTFALLTSSITTSSLRIGQWPLEEAANIAINDPTAATTSSGMLVMKMGPGVTNLPSQYVSTAFSTTGSTFVLPIPMNVNNVYVQIWGAGGGGTQNLYARGDGGGGAYLGGYLQVNPNSNLYVIVGKGGQSTISRGTFAEGWGGGSAGGGAGGAGGGFSALFANMSTPMGGTSSFLVIAGAGGGAGYGGDNGGWAAASGTSWTGARFNGTQYRTSYVPGGGYLTGGGGGGQYRAGDGTTINSIVFVPNNGGQFFGGTTNIGGGGGGGGYFGGGAGGNNQGDFYDNTGGGAGSSYGDLLKNPVLCNATGRTGGGSTIQGWSFGAGLGGSGTTNLPYNSGSNGLVIVTYQQPAIGKDKRFIEYRDLNNSTLSYVDSNGSLAIQVSSLVGGYAASIGAPSFMSTLVTDFVQTNQLNASGNLNVGGNAVFQGPTQISSLTVTTTTLTSTMLVGLSPFQSYMAFYGNTGDYNRTVIAEQSNGMVGGLNIQQELLLFRGPNATDRIRMQTTGYISFEPGVSSRTFPTVPSNVTPAMIINTSSNIGIQNANPLFPLDVTGIARATSLSTLNIQLSTINGQVFGSFSGSTNSLSAGTVTVSSLFTLQLNVSTTATISSLIVNSLQLGDGNGWVNAGPIQAVALSTIQLNTNDAYTNNLFVGIQSTASELQFFGLQGNYNNTVLAEISTGAGTQELLLFKGSSASDRVRVQTTGAFVIETGVSARLFSTNTIPTQSNVTPAFIVTINSNVGIQTATPGAALDVAGTARAITLSSQQLFVSSVNNSLLLGPPNLQSTVQGLGSAGYLSSVTSSFLTVSTGNLTTSTLTFLDELNSNTANVVYVQSTFLYFNTTIIGGATQLQPQLFSF